MYSLIYVDDNIVGYQADDVNGTFTQEQAYKCLRCNKLNPTQEEFDNVMQKIVNEKPMELLRGERSFLLQQTDWRITKGLEEGLDITPWKNYRSALRNLPQEIEAGSITAPTMNENEELIFNDWPTPPIE